MQMNLDNKTVIGSVDNLALYRGGLTVGLKYRVKVGSRSVIT